MTLYKAKTATAFAIVLMIASVILATVAQAQLSHIGNTPSTTPGYPNLGPLPAGVTPAYTVDTLAFMSLRPNPIGVGQTLLVNMWSSPGMYHAFYMCKYQVDIKKPDGSTETIGPLNSYTGDATAWFEYVPEQPGEWQFKFHHPGTYIPVGSYWDQPGSETGGFSATGKYYNISASIFYTASETDWQNLTVLPDMISSWPASPLPNDYWSRPVNVMWRDWGPNLGSYPFAGSVYYYPDGQRTLYASNYKYTAYVTAPNSAHVLRKQLNPIPGIAGMVGGVTYDYSLSAGATQPSIVFQGRAYMSVTKMLPNGTTGSLYQCSDLRTGQVYWERDMRGYPTPQYIEYNPPTGSTTIGDVADVGWSINFIAISGSFLYRYSPTDGSNTGNYSISPLSGGNYYRPGYVLTIQDLGSSRPNDQRYRMINWTTYGTSTNFTSRIAPRTYDTLGYLGKWNISFAYTSTGFGTAYDYEAGIFVTNAWNTPNPGPQWGIGVLMNVTDLFTGKYLWSLQTNDTLTYTVQSPSTLVCDHGKVAYGAHGRQWDCFDGRTGKLLWTSEKTAYPWGAWWPYNTASYNFNSTKGCIITGTYEGVYAIDWDTGKIIWHFKSRDVNYVPFENPYDATPFFTGVQIADGKVYAYNGEHTPSFPRTRDWSSYCLNATTGELIWQIKNPMVPGAIADGLMTASNSYDGNMYVFGKGQSATTVETPDAAIPLGTAFTIKGTVLDQSPAQPGTPCVSKDSMTTQMEYLHLQMPITGLWGNETITGVPVTLTAIGSDGTVTDIGTTTTNGYGGTFAMAWTPTKQDTYTIMASFAADDSYGSSMATTGVTVGPAPTTPETPEIPTPVDYTMTIAYAAIAIIIAVVIAVAVAVLLLRKR
jgi:outer membrane protein assembly factor BamB